VANVGAICDPRAFSRSLNSEVFPAWQQHECYLIVLGFTAVGTAAMLFFCKQTNAGGISLIRKDPRVAQGVRSRFWGVAAGRIG
jgi:hypothetical protein